MIVHTSSELGKVIKEIRKKQNLTQIELAAASGVGTRFLIELEQGKATASLEKTLTVIKMLGIEIDLKIPGEK